MGENALAGLCLLFEQLAVRADIGIIGKFAREFVCRGLDGGKRGGEFVRGQCGLGAESENAFVAQLFLAQRGEFLVACAQCGLHARDEKSDQPGTDEKVEPHSGEMHAIRCHRVGHRERLVVEKQQGIVAPRHCCHQPDPARTQTDRGNNDRHQHQRHEWVGDPATEKHQYRKRREVGQ